MKFRYSEDQCMTLAAAAHKLNVPKRRLEKLVSNGTLPALVFCDEDGKRHFRFDPVDIRRVMEEPKKLELPNLNKYRPGRMAYYARV